MPPRIKIQVRLTNLVCSVCGQPSEDVTSYEFEPGGDFELDGKRRPVVAYGWICPSCKAKQEKSDHAQN